MHVYMCMCVYVHVYRVVYVFVRVCMCVCMCVYVYTCVCMCVCMCVCIQHSFSIHSSADGCLGGFHVLAFVNSSAAMNVLVHIFSSGFSPCIGPEVGLLDHNVVRF